jgi:phage regulator Rha-like protein
MRSKRILLDSDLAELYGVKTKELNLAVRRNLGRFPHDFMFQLTTEEARSLRFQIETSKVGRGGRRYLPYAFTQEGVAMLSGVLNSPRAIQVNILIMRAFIKLREMVIANELIRQKIEELEQKYEKHDKHIKTIIEALRDLLKPVEPPKKKSIGFHVKY